jgi:hypothetical protein
MKWVLQARNENNFNPRILNPAKSSFNIDETTKIFHNKQKLKQYMTTKPPLQKILQGILHTENESKENMKGQAVPNQRIRKGKKVEICKTDSAINNQTLTHNQTLKQEKQLNDRIHQIPINTNTECY